jgi:hypothetical protein
MSKLYGKPYRHDQPLLDNSAVDTAGCDERNLQTRRQRKLMPSAAEPVRLKKFANNVKSNVSSRTNNIASKIHLMPARSAHYGYSISESRDDELEGRYLLTVESDERYRLSFGEEREMPVPSRIEEVDFGGFDLPEKRVDEQSDGHEKETTGTISISSASASVKDDDASIDSREYSRMYATITRGAAASEESDPSIFTEGEESEEPTEADCDAESVLVRDVDEMSVGSIKSVLEMNNALQLQVDENSITGSTSVRSRDSCSDENSIRRLTTASSYLQGVYLIEDESMASDSAVSVVSSTAVSSILHGVDFAEATACEDVIKVYTSQSDSDESAGDESIGLVLGDGATVTQISPMDDPSYVTPTKLPTIPTMSFSVDSPSEDRKFTVCEKHVVVTPTEHGDVIVLGALGDDTPDDRSDNACDAAVDNDTIQIDLHPKFAGAMSTSSEESVTSNSTAAALSFSGLQVHDFDDDVFNVTQLDEESVASDFNTRDDWKPQEDDTDSVCSQPFGCCTINVDVKRAILSASKNVASVVEQLPSPSTPRSLVASDDISSSCHQADGTEEKDNVISINELSPPSTPKITIFNDHSPRFVYPEITMLDMLSYESDYESSNSSSQPGVFHLSDRFKELVESESDSSDEEDEILNCTQNDVNNLNQEEQEIGTTDAVDEISTESGDDDSLDEASCVNNILDELSRTASVADGVDEISNESGDDASVEEASCVSNILNESSRTASVISDDGTSFDLLKNFWSKEWSSVANNQVDEKADMNDASEETDSECLSLGESLQDLEYEYADIDSRSFVSRALLETVAEMADESEDDSGIESDEVIDENYTHLMAEGDPNESSNDGSMSPLELNVSEDERGRDLSNVEIQSPPQITAAFRSARTVKKQYARAKKYAVVKANSAKSVKFCLEHNMTKYSCAKNADGMMKSDQLGEPDVDEVVKIALDLISKRTGGSCNSISNEVLSDGTSQSSSSMLNVRDQMVPPMVMTLNEPELTIPADRLGQLRNYLSPNARENEQVSLIIDDLNDNVGCAAEVVGASEDRDVESTSDVLPELVEKAEEHITEESNCGDDTDNVVVKESLENPHQCKRAFLHFDDVNPPELGSLTQKLFYTNTELAEELALAQSELAIANKRAETLAMERDELLASTSKTCGKEERVVVQNEEGDLLTWLDEKNELID